LLRCARNDGEALCRPVEHYDIKGTRLMRTRKPITPGDPQAGAETFAKFDCSPRVSAVPRVLDREDAALDVLLRQAGRRRWTIPGRRFLPMKSSPRCAPTTLSG
jgi:hypothetical protein